eukprot:11892-Heterococcus_DN1.PRE.4
MVQLRLFLHAVWAALWVCACIPAVAAASSSKPKSRSHRTSKEHSIHDSNDVEVRDAQQQTAKRHIDPQRAKLRRKTTTHPTSRSLEFHAESSLKARMEQLLTITQKYSREARGVMSSELEQITLKATRPDDMPVKAKHIEALLRPSYEMPPELNVYSPIVRKLWSKMRDTEWRVVLKSLYALHKLSTDGSMAQAINLKSTMELLSKQNDPKCKPKCNFFDLDEISRVHNSHWHGGGVTQYSDFIRLYAKYVICRATTFGPGYAELLDGYTMVGSTGNSTLIQTAGSTSNAIMQSAANKGSLASAATTSAATSSATTTAAAAAAAPVYPITTATAPHDVQSYIAAIEQLFELALQVQVATTITATTAQLAVPAMAQIAVACDIRNAVETIATQAIERRAERLAERQAKQQQQQQHEENERKLLLQQQQQEQAALTLQRGQQSRRVETHKSARKSASAKRATMSNEIHVISEESCDSASEDYTDVYDDDDTYDDHVYDGEYDSDASE